MMKIKMDMITNIIVIRVSLNQVVNKLTWKKTFNTTHEKIKIRGYNSNHFNL